MIQPSKFGNALVGPFCPSCRSTRNEPLQFWASPQDGIICIDPFHGKQLEAEESA